MESHPFPDRQKTYEPRAMLRLLRGRDDEAGDVRSVLGEMSPLHLHSRERGCLGRKTDSTARAPHPRDTRSTLSSPPPPPSKSSQGSARPQDRRSLLKNASETRRPVPYLFPRGGTPRLLVSPRSSTPGRPRETPGVCPAKDGSRSSRGSRPRNHPPPADSRFRLGETRP